MTHDYRTTFVLSQLASKKELVFDVAFGKYEEGVTVVFHDGPRGDNEKFTVNKDGSISPLKAPNLVIGMIATALQHDNTIPVTRVSNGIFGVQI